MEFIGFSRNEENKYENLYSDSGRRFAGYYLRDSIGR
jgi:hypothetical protein